jgi:hypothetical protein
MYIRIKGFVESIFIVLDVYNNVRGYNCILGPLKARELP